GIRDDLVTGVQTCALPIFQEALDPLRPLPAYPGGQGEFTLRQTHHSSRRSVLAEQPLRELASDSGEGRDKVCLLLREALAPWRRSEERRVGKGWRCGGWMV